jgi:hypothetical protein
MHDMPAGPGRRLDAAFRLESEWSLRFQGDGYDDTVMLIQREVRED